MEWLDWLELSISYNYKISINEVYTFSLDELIKMFIFLEYDSIKKKEAIENKGGE